MNRTQAINLIKSRRFALLTLVGLAIATWGRGDWIGWIGLSIMFVACALWFRAGPE